MPASRLSPAELRLTVDAASLGFADTSELLHHPLPWIGQERAQSAARFGLSMDLPDYNLFVLGEVGSGRTTLLCQMMHEIAASRPVPPDLCYLHNFDAPERPRALRMPAGQGRQLRSLMQQLVKTMQAEIPKRLGGEDFRAESEHLRRTYKAEEARAYAELDAFAETRRFALMRDQGHLVFTLRDEQGEPMTEAKVLALPKERRAEMDRAEEELRGEIARFLEKTRALERVLNEGLAALRRQMVKPLLERELQDIRSELRKQIKDTVKLGSYLDQVARDVLDNVELFAPAESEEEEADATERAEALQEVLRRYQVNVVVDNHDRQGAPVIVEDNPLFRTLFGSVEYQTENDVLVSDHTRIRAGSLLKAHGGFLLQHLRDLVADDAVWEKLRRFLRSGRLQIEEPGMIYAPIAAVSLQPEPVDVDVKIVLIGSVDEYYALQEADPDLARRFRCKVDFAESFRATPAARLASAIFVAHTCRRLGLPHFRAEAVAALLEQAHREAEDQTRQSAIFAHTEALVMEAAAMARSRGATLVDAQDVEAARLARIQRHDYPEQRLQETIADGERLLDLDGERIAQVNGLTVVDLGDYRFGFPVRVTARTHAGDEGLLNIEREVELSGPIHDKGVLILHSYLAHLFVAITPLALNAAIVFEQEYSGVEGDSASLAEFGALLSALAGAPVRQSVAVTGALNQHGELLPVGGINEKIEGFFRSCSLMGLTGRQGVLIPRRNRRHLMLDPRVVQAVAQGRFHIWAADTAAEALELLTGLPFGEPDAEGHYSADTLLGRAQQTLQAYRRASQATVKAPRKPRGKAAGGLR
jgi:predicted ATP-dependent protease